MPEYLVFDSATGKLKVVESETCPDNVVGKSYFKLHIIVYKTLYVLASWLHQSDILLLLTVKCSSSHALEWFFWWFLYGNA